MAIFAKVWGKRIALYGLNIFFQHSSNQIKSNQFYLDTAYLTNDSGVFTIKKIIIMIKIKNKKIKKYQKQITIIYITRQSIKA